MRFCEYVVGFGIACRVANELGAGQPMAAKRAAHVALVFAVILMSVLAIPLFVFRYAFA
jgi:Na+-driven multidrug efflux pump